VKLTLKQSRDLEMKMRAPLVVTDITTPDRSE
jgi:hypothetical protein